MPSRRTARRRRRRGCAGRARRLGGRRARDRRRGPRRQSWHRGRQRFRLGPHRAPLKSAPADGLSAHAWTGLGVGADAGEAPDLEAYVAEAATLGDHLQRQAAILLADPAERLIGAALIDALDDAGYFVGSIAEIADRLGAAAERVERLLLRMQCLEPTGVFARSLAECLALQLRERDRFDPAMQALIENLPALAKRDFPLLRRACGVDDEDLRDMIAEIRRLEPKPGRAFGDPPRGAGDSRCPCHRRARFRLAGRTQHEGAAAGPRQRGLCRRDPARRQARRGQAVRLDPTPGRQLADQEPRAARAHHPQRRERNRAAPGFLPARRRLGPEAAQSEDGRRSDRRPRIRRSRARPPTSSFRRPAACSR